jgi:hypothetical protein
MKSFFEIQSNTDQMTRGRIVPWMRIVLCEEISTLRDLLGHLLWQLFPPTKRISENEDMFNEWLKQCETLQHFRDLLIYLLNMYLYI